VYLLAGTDPVDEIIRFAREHRITQIFIGHSQRNRWLPLTRNPVDRLIEAAEGIDVRIFPQSQQ
jgi:K+-sensing histidine kinase KdpD